MKQKTILGIGLLLVVTVLLGCGHQTSAASAEKTLSGRELIAAALSHMEQTKGVQIESETIASWQTADHKSNITLRGKHQLTAEPFGLTGTERLSLCRTLFADQQEVRQEYTLQQRTEQQADGSLVLFQLTDYDQDNRWEEERIVYDQGADLLNNDWQDYSRYISDVLVANQTEMIHQQECYVLTVSLSDKALPAITAHFTALGLDLTALQEAWQTTKEPFQLTLWITKENPTLVKQTFTLTTTFEQLLQNQAIAIKQPEKAEVEKEENDSAEVTEKQTEAIAQTAPSLTSTMIYSNLQRENKK